MTQEFGYFSPDIYNKIISWLIPMMRNVSKQFLHEKIFELKNMNFDKIITEYSSTRSEW